MDTLLGEELCWKLLPTASVKDWTQGYMYTNLSFADVPLCSLELEAGMTTQPGIAHTTIPSTGMAQEGVLATKD